MGSGPLLIVNHLPVYIPLVNHVGSAPRLPRSATWNISNDSLSATNSLAELRPSADRKEEPVWSLFSGSDIQMTGHFAKDSFQSPANNAESSLKKPCAQSRRTRFEGGSTFPNTPDKLSNIQFQHAQKHALGTRIPAVSVGPCLPTVWIVERPPELTGNV